MKLIAVLLLVVMPVLVTAASWLCRWYTTFHIVASGTVYCDAQRTQLPTHATVTLMDDDGGDGSGDDEASYDKQLGGLKPRADLVNGHFQVGGSMTDNIPTNHPEPYLLVKGVCPVEKNNGVVGRWHFEEKYGLPCNWQCNEHVLQVGGLVIILDGVRERPIC